MSSEDNILEDDVGSSVENDCVEDDVGTSGIENTGEENAEHSDNEASGGRQRQQNSSQETSKENENSKDGERFKDERNDPLIGRCQEDEVVVNNVGNLTYSSEQMELSTLVQAKSSAQESLLVLALKSSSENKREEMRKSLEQFFINKQRLAKKSGILYLFYYRTYDTRLFVYALCFSIGVIPVPYEARYEHFRLSTFGHGRDLYLVQGVVMRLTREGFFCDITGSVVCYSCAHVITPDSLNQSLHHLGEILQNHICPMQGNVPIGEYGIDCAQLLGSALAIAPSGQPYQGHGVVQQNRLQPGVPYGRIVTSLTSFDQQNRLSHVNLASQGNAAQGYIDRSSNEVNEQEMETIEGANIGGVFLQDGQPTSNVGGHSAGGTSHQSNTTQYSAMPQTGRACTAHGMKTTLPSGKRDREQWSRMECDRLGASGVEDGRDNQYGTHESLRSALAIAPSGQPYHGHGVVQQNRLQPGVPYGRIVTSLTSFDQQNRLSHVNLASQGNAAQGYIDRSSNEVNEQEMETREGSNIGPLDEGVSLQGAGASGIEDGRGNQYGTHDLVESSVNHPDDSELEHTFVRKGFSSHSFREAVRRLQNRGDTIDYDSVMGELERIGAHPE